MISMEGSAIHEEFGQDLFKRISAGGLWDRKAFKIVQDSFVEEDPDSKFKWNSTQNLRISLIGFPRGFSRECALTGLLGFMSFIVIGFSAFRIGFLRTDSCHCDGRPVRYLSEFLVNTPFLLN